MLTIIAVMTTATIITTRTPSTIMMISETIKD